MARRSGASNPERISELERQLGIHPSGSAVAPREFPTLPGVDAEACLLPLVTSEDQFDDRYGIYFQRTEPSANLTALNASITELEQITEGFATYAKTHGGQQLIDAAEVALRRIGRVEQAMEPVFAGLSFGHYGRGRKACLEARARIGNTLDEITLTSGA